MSILTSVTCSDESAVLLPGAQGQRIDLWKVPALFGDTPVKKDFLPLGFQFSPQPEQGQRCDLLNCSISNDTSWKIFEGCWHSLHICYLDVDDVCPICRQGIEDAIRSLASTANKSAQIQESEGVDCLDNDNSQGIQETGDYDSEILTSSIEANVDQILQNLTQQVIALPVTKPPVQPAQPSSRILSPSSQPPPCQSSSQRRPPHCSTCIHLLQGHQRLALTKTSFGKSCPVCPSKLCAREGHSIPCACHWCLRQSQPNPDITALSSVSQGPNVLFRRHTSIKL